MNEELRCYTFTNNILKSIQQGIQPAHAISELFVKYQFDETLDHTDEKLEMLYDWAHNHKTLVCLDGGNADGVRDWQAFIELGYNTGDNVYPHSSFYEDKETLDKGLTSVAIILPARIFKTAAALRGVRYDDTVSSTWDEVLGELRVSFLDPAGGVPRVERFTRWERDLMNKLNKTSLAR